MAENQVQAIWTGITDLPEDWQRLAVPEIVSIREIWKDQRKRLNGSAQLTQFSERLGREWAIETGVIENLYEIERGVTQTLIEQGFQSAILEHGTTNKPKEFVIALLKDQQDALEGLFDFVKQRRKLGTSYIRELHAAMLRSQPDVDAYDQFGKPLKVPLSKGDWKKLPNFPTKEGVTFTYCPPEHVASEMDRLVELHQAHVESGVSPEVESAWLHHRFAQIHPFQDGNGRVARALASLEFIRNELFPLVVSRDDNMAYLDALESADAGDLKPLVDLFSKLQRKQFIKATALSEELLDQKKGVKQAMQGLLEAAKRKEEERQKAFEKVFDHALGLEKYALERLGSIAEDMTVVLQSLDRRNRASVDRSGSEDDYYFRGQIIEIAKLHLGYFANTTDYRSWVRLKAIWERRAQIVFAFHANGGFFSGVLVCAPFLEFMDQEDDTDPKRTLVPITGDPFIFYYNETYDRVQARFEPWFDDVMTTAIAEIQRNL